MQSDSKSDGRWISRDNRKRLLIVAGLCLLLVTLGKYLLSPRTETIYYKLTVSLNTPDGIKTGSTVNKLVLTKGYFPQVGYFFHQEGQALFVDLGANRKPLIALLLGPCAFETSERCSPKNPSVFENAYDAAAGPFLLLTSHNSLQHMQGDDQFVAMKVLRTQHSHLELKPEELPSLITFDNISDPHSAMAIDPLHLEDTLGPGISWKAMTIDVVAPQPLTFDLDKKLPWFTELRKRAQGTGASSMYGLGFKGIGVTANTLMFYDFEHPVR